MLKIESFVWKGRKRAVVRDAVSMMGMTLALLAGMGTGFISPPALAAEPPPVLWGKEPLVCPTGTEAGNCSNPRGVAANPTNGHLFVVDQLNSRINEFNALGQFIKTWGWGVDTGAAELQTCTEASTCQAGVPGSGAGQFSEITLGAAVDSAGNVYVQDRGFLGSPNVRVEKFSPAGEFLLMFGGEVNKTKVEAGGASEAEENLCPFAPGDECKAGTIGTGQGQFGEWAIASFIAIDNKHTETDADDKVYVGDVNRIQIFDTGGHYQGEFAVPGTVEGLAVDDDGNLYAIINGAVRKISPTGILLPLEFEFEISAPATAVAVDSDGNVFAFRATVPGNQAAIVEFDAEGKQSAEFGKGEFSASNGLATNLCPGSEAPGNLYVTNASLTNAFLRAYGTEPIGCFRARTLPADPIEETAATLNGTVNPKGEAVTECFFEYGATNAYGQTAQCDAPKASEIGTGSEPVPVHADIGDLEKASVYHFRLIANVGGETETGGDEAFKTLGPPVISEDHTAGVTGTEASLKALVNPEGFATTCQFKYGTSAIYGQSTPSQPIGKDGDRSNRVAFGDLKGLAPGSAYHWQIVCANKSGTAASADHVLRTYLPFAPDTGCLNDEFRSGASAFLPDCRAYEMVSPVDKNGGDVVREKNADGDPGNYVQAAPDGNSITYTTSAAYRDVASSFRFNQYLAARRERGEVGEGWSNQGINPAVAGQEVPGGDSFGLHRYFMALAPDLCSAWLIDIQTPAPTANGQEDLPNLYRRDNCGEGAGGLEALVPNPPYHLPLGTERGYVTSTSVEGYSEDSRHAIFAASAQLMEEAAAGSGVQLYDRFGSALHLVSVRPDGASGDPAPGDGKGFAAPGSSTVGSGFSGSLDNAVSGDGSRVYWTSDRLYLRQHPEKGIVAGECSEAALACTVPVSTSGALFWTAAENGSKALYSEGEELYEFSLDRYDAKEEASEQIADHVIGVAGASQDLGRIYFVSTDALTGEEEGEGNSEEDFAVDGEPNLYLKEGSATSFVARLVAGDVGAIEPGVVNLAYDLSTARGFLRATRVSPDGSRIAFQSRARLTDYDNTAQNGKASVEVFAYEAGGALVCISCNPSGARPSGVGELREPYAPPWDPRPTKVFAAASIPTWEHPLHASNVLSANGNRLFFNANDALLPGDTNGAQDVYEWEAAGTGSCDVGDANYFAENGGCLSLISSGESPYESDFWEASADGRDVFFTTESSLLPQDPGSIDLYDARTEGGFPQPEVRAPCEGEACQSPPPPPEFSTPSSSSYSGPGNPPPSKTCPKGKRKVRKGGKVHCAKKHHKKQHKRHRRANHDRRAGR